MVVIDKIILKVVEQYLKYYLSNFDRNSLKLGFLSGEMSLENMEVNPHFLKEMMFVQQISVKRVMVNKIIIKIPWKNLFNEPISMTLDTVECDVAEAFENDPPKKKKPSSYGFIGKCFDGVNIQIKQINMNFETYDGILNNPKPRRVRMFLSNLNIFSTNSAWQKCELKDVFIRNKEKTAVIFHKKLECESVSFAFETTNPETQETGWSTPLSQLPLDITIRVKKEVSDGDVLCGEIGLIFDSMNVTFKEYEWHQMFDFCKGLVTMLTKKLNDSPESPSPSPSPARSSNNNIEKSPSSSDDQLVDDIPFDDFKSNSRPHIWNEPKKVIKTEEAEWDLVKSDISDFNQTKFTVIMKKGKLTMSENTNSDDASNHFALFLFDDLIWTCHISPYEYRKKKILERLKLKKKEPKKPVGNNNNNNNNKGPTIRKKLAVMNLNLQKILILGSYPDRVNLLHQYRDDNEAAIQIKWLVHTEHPDEQDMMVWLRSLIIDMFIDMHNVNVIFQREEWFRMLRFFNLTNTATALSDATSSVEFRLHGDVTNSMILLTDRTKYKEGDQCLKITAKKARFGSELGLPRNDAFDQGIFLRYIDQSVEFPAGAEDFTYGERFVNAMKPRRFQFLIEKTSGFIDEHQILEPCDFRIEFNLQKFLDKNDENKITGENLIAYLDMNETELSITASQYAYFYKTVFHMFDDIKREFIPSLSKSVPVDDESLSPYRDLIPSYIPGFADKLKVRIYDDDILDVQLRRGKGEDVPYPPAPLLVTMRGLSFVSEIYSSKKIAAFAVNSVEIVDKKYEENSQVILDEHKDANCLSGRFVFALDDINSSSKILLHGINCQISKENLARAQTFIKSQNEGLSKRVVVLNENNHEINFQHCNVTIDEEKYEGFPPELIHLLKEVIPFWR